jgi:flagellar hook protein FlgE
VPSIVNGLFAARSGISSHGTAIAVVGDNISNASTTGYKASRSEFADLIAGGQSSGRVVGAGSTTPAVTTIFDQGSIEFTNRPLDLAVDGSGFFVVADGDQRYYTRAGNFKVDPSGFIVNQNGFAVLGFPANGTGGLQPINTNTVSQDSVSTTSVEISGNVDAAGTPSGPAGTLIPTVPAPGAGPGTVTYSDLNNAATYSTVVDVFDSLGAAHTVNVFFYHTTDNPNTYTVRGYVNASEVETGATDPNNPRELFTFDMAFNSDGSRTAPPTTATPDVSVAGIPWANGSDQTLTVDFRFDPFTQYSAPSNILAITQNGKGIGNVGSFSIEKDGTIFALLSNGQSAIIGTIGMVNFSNPEGLARIGGNLLQQSPQSGEPVVGRPTSGTFGAVQSGSLELSTVDIANEFVKLITLQRGFQANSRIITTINQLLNEIIQLA